MGEEEDITSEKSMDRQYRERVWLGNAVKRKGCDNPGCFNSSVCTLDMCLMKKRERNNPRCLNSSVWTMDMCKGPTLYRTLLKGCDKVRIHWEYHCLGLELRMSTVLESILISCLSEISPRNSWEFTPPCHLRDFSWTRLQELYTWPHSYNYTYTSYIYTWST